MKLWLVSQNINNGYDTFDAIVVCAETRAEACKIYPREMGQAEYERNGYREDSMSNAWVDADQVSVKCIGEALRTIKKGVVLASFKAG